MGKIEIAVLVISAIIILVGFSKGLMKQIFSTSAWLVAIIGAFLLCSPVYSFVETTSINTAVGEKVGGFIGNKLGDLGEEALTSENITAKVNEALQSIGLPDFLNGKLSEAIVGSGSFEGYEGTLNDLLIPAVTKIAVTVICFIVIFIVAIIVLKIIGGILIRLFDKGILGFANRLAGAVLGVVIALLVVNLLLFVLPIVETYVPSVQQFVQTDLATEGGLGVAKYFYNNNWITLLINNSFNFEVLIDEVKNTVETLS